eukprot:XP_011662619.1 PREDICTED: uncharacterized protein LOC105437570 [Strongylocentrotus purpuratus]
MDVTRPGNATVAERFRMTQTPMLSCSQTRGLPGLPPLPAEGVDQPSDLYQIVLKHSEHPPIMQGNSWTLAAPFKEQKFHRTPSESIANNYTPSASHLKIKSLPRPNLPRATTQAHMTRKRSHSPPLAKSPRNGTMPDIQTRGLPGLPPLPAEGVDQPSDLYQIVLKHSEHPPIMQGNSWTLAAPFKEQKFHRTPSESIANNYTPSASHLKIKSLPRPNLPRATTQAHMTRKRSHSPRILSISRLNDSQTKISCGNNGT